MDNRISRSTTQACASCKYQRRKCGPNCILAPYFPHDRQKQFLNAQRLFGVGKMTNMIKDLDQRHRDLAMNTILYESDMRARDRVGGCYRLVLHLQSQIDYANQELQSVLQQLAFIKAQPTSQVNPNSTHIVNVMPQLPYLEQFPQQQQQQVNANYNSLTDDINNIWAIHTTLPFSPLSLENDIHDQDPVLHYGYHQKPDVLDLMNNMTANDIKSDPSAKY